MINATANNINGVQNNNVDDVDNNADGYDADDVNSNDEQEMCM